MGKILTFRPWNQEQILLLISLPTAWFTEYHLGFFLEDLLVEFDPGMGVIKVLY